MATATSSHNNISNEEEQFGKYKECHRFAEKTSEGKLHARKAFFVFFRTKDD